METIKDKLNNFRQIVIENCKNKDFEYKEWFVKDHLMIVERIAMELCDIYKEADREIIFALVWFHDFGQAIDLKNIYETTKKEGTQAMKDAGLPENFIEKVLKFWERMEMKNEIDISKEPIEVQILSSADGASHFVGKFYPTYFEDLQKEGLKTIMEELKIKIKVDWERKIVLPEIKKAFADRYLKALEVLGEYPEKFILMRKND